MAERAKKRPGKSNQPETRKKKPYIAKFVTALDSLVTRALDDGELAPTGLVTVEDPEVRKNLAKKIRSIASTLNNLATTLSRMETPPKP
jgi:hypothetical protein